MSSTRYASSLLFMRSFLIPAILLAFTSPSLRADSWRERLEEFDEVREIPAPEGQMIYDEPGRGLLKEIEKPGKIQVKAKVEWEGREYFISDWSWNRFQQGHEPNWIWLPGRELPDPGEDAEEAPPAGVESAQEPEPEVAREEKSVAAPPLPQPQAEEGSESEWGGRLEVFDREKVVQSQRGYVVLAEPRAGGRVLKRVRSKGPVSAKVSLTFPNGAVYYASGWSWRRAQNGERPNWIHLTGEPEFDGSLAIASADEGPVKRESGSGSPPPEFRYEAPASERQAAKVPTGGTVRIGVLLVGNADYSSQNVLHKPLDLPEVDRDIELLAESFRARQAHVRVVKNVNRQGLLHAVQEEVAKLDDQDVFFFYYAGHGFQWKGKNYLAPLGMRFFDKGDLLKRAVGLEEVLEITEAKALRFSGIVLDGSRPNPLHDGDALTKALLRVPGLDRVSRSPRTKGGFRQVEAPKNTLIAFASAPDHLVLPGARAGEGSLYAAALSTALARDVEIREVFEAAGNQVSAWTGGRQKPWFSEEDFGRFYAHVPGRRRAAPDAEAVMAGQLIERESESALSMAIAHLARSVRSHPEDNASVAALLYLLSYQTLPVPLSVWGPFDVPDKEFRPELEVSLDGWHIGLYGEKGDDPALIVDRESGRRATGIDGSFVPGYTTASLRLERPRWEAAKENPALATVCAIERSPGFGLEPEPAETSGVAPTHAVTPLLVRGEAVASHFDEGLERLYVATRSGDKRLYVSEFATSPPVEVDEDLMRLEPRPVVRAAGKREELAHGLLSEDGSKKWRLVLEPGAEAVRLETGEADAAYLSHRASEKGGALRTWSLDPSAQTLALVFERRIDFIDTGGTLLNRLGIRPLSDRARVMAFSANFRRLVVVDPEKGERVGRLRFFDLGRGAEMAVGKSVKGYSGYAALSADEEWFFFYDPERRLRMIDLVTAGDVLNLPATGTPVDLPETGVQADEDEFAMPFQLEQPPLLGRITEYEQAPAWLADLSESLLGFQLNDAGAIQWFDDAPARLRAVVEAMEKQGDRGQFAEWRQWFLVNRLGALEL